MVRIGDFLHTIGMKWQRMTMHGGDKGWLLWINTFRRKLSLQTRLINQLTNRFRIDHILGFFRIWEIPANCVSGLLGRFNPSNPLWRNELEAVGLWDINRLCGNPVLPSFLMLQNPTSDSIFWIVILGRSKNPSKTSISMIWALECSGSSHNLLQKRPYR